MSEATDWVKCPECGHVMLGPVTECSKCGYIFEGTEPPEKCPSCKHPTEYYEPECMCFECDCECCN